MRIKWKTYICICLIILLCGYYASCKETVVMLTAHKNMQIVANRFNNSQEDLHLEVRMLTTGSIYEEMATNPVDLVFVNVMDTVKIADHMIRLNNYLQSDAGLRSTFNRLLASMPSNYIYAMPVMRNLLTVYVHNNTMEKAGMASVTKWTWDEFYMWVTRLAASKLHRYGTVLESEVWAAPFIQLGGSMQGPFEKAEYGLRIIKKIQDTTDVHVPVYSIGFSGNSQSFLSREAASSINVTQYARILKENGYIPGNAGWRTLPLPTVDGEQQMGISVYDSHCGISASSRKKDQAWKVLRWLVLDEGATAIVDAGYVPYNIYPSIVVGLQNAYGAVSRDVFPSYIATIYPYADTKRPTINVLNQYVSDYFKGYISVQKAIAGMNASVGKSD